LARIRYTETNTHLKLLITKAYCMTSLTDTSLSAYLPASIQNKSILITGATTGIGRATALLLAAQGANVLIVGQDEQHLQDTLQDFQSAGPSGKVHSVLADLASEEGINRVFAEVDSQFGKLDVLINNAALAYQSITEGERSAWQKVVDTNLVAYLSCAHHAVTRMQAHGKGHIINIGSMSADVREKGSSVYVATKSAIQGFSESLRKEVNESGIKVSLIEPGAVGTDMQPVSVPDQQQKEENLEMLKAEDIAAAVLYTLSQPERCDIVELKIRPHLQTI